MATACNVIAYVIVLLMGKSFMLFERLEKT